MISESEMAAIQIRGYLTFKRMPTRKKTQV